MSQTRTNWRVTLEGKIADTTSPHRLRDEKRNRSHISVFEKPTSLYREYRAVECEHEYLSDAWSRGWRCFEGSW